MTARGWRAGAPAGVMLGVVLGVVLGVLPRAAWAHTGRAPEPHDLWRAWTLEPAAIVTLVVGAAWYRRGVIALWRRAGVGRGVSRRRAWCFSGALAATAVALLSPIDAIGSALFSVHMVQHLLLMMVAAPLLVLGDLPSAGLWALATPARRRLGLWWRRARPVRALWAAVTHPGVAWTSHVAALWVWHSPPLYDRALLDERVHVAEHATFFITALLFWWPLLRPHGRRLGAPAAVGYLFAAALQGTILGAVITLARHPWYVVHYGTTSAWGLSPLEDQELAGLIMWIPAGLIYLVPAAWRLAGALASTPACAARQRDPLSLAAGVSARGTP